MKYEFLVYLNPSISIPLVLDALPVSLTPTTLGKCVPLVSGSGIFCQTKPGLQNRYHRLDLAEDSRTTDV